MKILLLSNSDGGLYKFRKELIEKLIADGHELYVSLPKGEFTETLINMGCRFEECDFDGRGTNPISELKQIGYYKKLIKRIAPDIVFSYTIKPNVYGGMACSALKVPYVVNVTGLGTAVEYGGIMQKITVALYRMGIKKAQKVFFQNTENRDFMVNNKIVKGEYDMLPGSGVNLEQYNVTEYPSGDTIDFMFIARIMKEKGIDQYVDTAKAIRAKYPNTRFHICGACTDEYKDKIKALEEDGTIIYHGLVKDIAAMHTISSCTIHPTYYPEGLSNVLLESCACGRPIITTDRAGCREVVEDGKNGYVVRQRDSADVIEKTEKFLSLSYEERKAMGLAGRAKVEKEFSRQLVIEKYLAELEKVRKAK